MNSFTYDLLQKIKIYNQHKNGMENYYIILVQSVEVVISTFINKEYIKKKQNYNCIVFMQMYHLLYKFINFMQNYILYLKFMFLTKTEFLDYNKSSS